MKEFSLLFLFLILVGAGAAGYRSVSNAVNIHYMCGVEVPLYAAFFLNPSQCPNYGRKLPVGAE